MDRLTVLLPARNAAKTVGKALNSVLRSMPDDARVLVLDDASDDGTGAIVAQIARRDGRVGVIRSETASGSVAGAVNILLEAADTPLIARMDADDIVLPWRFASQLRALERRSLDMVFTPAVMFGPGRLAVRPQPPFGAGPGAIPYELLLTCTLLHPTLIGRRAAFDSAGGYRSVPAEDWDLFIRMALNGDRMARMSLPGILYRRHAGQVTANKQWQTAHAARSDTADVHDELCRRLLGPSRGAYAALSGSGAGFDELVAARDLLEAVWKVAGKFGYPDGVGVRANVVGVRRQLNARYPVGCEQSGLER